MDDDFMTDGIDAVAIPKVSLHDHLDGALRPETILDLADEAGVDVPADDADALADWFVDSANSGSLTEYLETFAVTTAVLQTAESLERAAREYVLDLADDGVVYGEVRWAPEQHLQQGLTLDEAVAAVRRGLEDGMDETDEDVRVQQLLCGMRQGDRVDEIARLAVRHRARGVAGFDIAGPEDGFAPSRFAGTFDYLAKEFMPVTVHAGEAAGLDSIREALTVGRALRLGHGVRIAEDIEVSDERDALQVMLGQTAEWVKDRGIALELSVTSNLGTGAIEQWGDDVRSHPIDLLFQLGFKVTVNTDNRLQSGTTLSRELSILSDAFGYDLIDHEALQLHVAAAAFLPVDEREELADIISDGFDDLQ